MQPLENYYGELLIGAGDEQMPLIYTVPAGKTAYVQAVGVSGEALCAASLFHDASKFAVKRSSYGAGFDLMFSFIPSGAAGLVFGEGEQLKVSILNGGASPAIFNASIQVIEV
jgi:hypothetical protein